VHFTISYNLQLLKRFLLSCPVGVLGLEGVGLPMGLLRLGIYLSHWGQGFLALLWDLCAITLRGQVNGLGCIAYHLFNNLSKLRVIY